MRPSIPAPETLVAQASPDFSIVVGGPLFRLWHRFGLATEALEGVWHRIAVAVLLSWVPLLLLSMAEGRAWVGSAALPFVADVELHVRLLLVVPLMIGAEVVVQRRMHMVVRHFLERGLIPPGERARFDAAIASAIRLRNSAGAEIVLLALVYGIGVLYIWRTQVALHVTSWYATSNGQEWSPSAAGWWLACVSLPLFQFLLLRWYYRLCIWTRFLWQVSRIKLRLVPTHPDRCGGLGFLGFVRVAFAPLLLAQGAMLAGLMASRILFDGAQLPEFKLELVGLAGFMVLVILGPLLVFSGQLEEAGRTGEREYGKLAQDYVRAFEQKWLRGGAPESEQLIGSADVQSLADLASSFEIVKEMRWAPFTWKTVVQLAVTTLLPVLPLTLTMFSPQELLERLLKMVF